MKIPLFLLAGFILAGASVPTASAARLDFSDYAGSYRSNYQLLYNGALVQSPRLPLTITAAKNGGQARIFIRGYATVSAGTASQTVALLGTLTLNADRRIIADNALLAFFVQLPARGRLRGSGKSLTFTLASSVSGLGDFSTTYRLRQQKRRLVISGVGVSPNGPTSLRLVARKRGR